MCTMLTNYKHTYTFLWKPKQLHKTWTKEYCTVSILHWLERFPFLGIQLFICIICYYQIPSHLIVIMWNFPIGIKPTIYLSSIFDRYAAERYGSSPAQSPKMTLKFLLPLTNYYYLSMDNLSTGMSVPFPFSDYKTSYYSLCFPLFVTYMFFTIY